MTATSVQRHTRSNPCGVCGGYETQEHGSGKRCFGFDSSDGKYIHCTREEYGNGCQFHPASDTFSHITSGHCKCGNVHGISIPSIPARDPLPFSNHSAKASKKVDDSIDFVQPQYITRTDFYHDPEGVLALKVIRYDHPTDPDKKTYRQQYWVGNQWVWHVDNPKDFRFLWNLPAIIAAPDYVEIHITEGEKSAEALTKLGFVATTAPMGAGKWEPQYTDYLQNRHVVIHADYDEPGERHVAVVAEAIYDVVKSIKVIRYPDQGEGGDVYDFLNSGTSRTKFDIVKLMTAAPFWPNDAQYEFGFNPPESSLAELPAITSYFIDDLDQIPSVNWLLKPFIQDRAINMISGESGIGKTFIAVDQALKIAGFANVLYIAAEDPTQYPERVKGWRKYYKMEEKGRLKFWLETGDFHLLNATTVDRILRDYKDNPPRFIAIDTYHAATEGAQENDNGQIGTILGQIRRFIREWGSAINLVHHFNKGGDYERGGSALKAGCMQALRVLGEGDGVKVVFDKVRGAAKPDDISFRWELVPIVVSTTDVITGEVIEEERVTRIPIQTSGPVLDTSNLTPPQHRVLVWLGQEVNRADWHKTADIEQDVSMPNRTLTHALKKLAYMGLIEKQERGASKITHAGLLRAGYKVAPLF